MNALRLRMLPCAYAYRTCEHPYAYACAYARVVRVNQPSADIYAVLLSAEPGCVCLAELIRQFVKRLHLISFSACWLSTRPTCVGKISEDSGLANISRVIFNVFYVFFIFLGK